MTEKTFIMIKPDHIGLADTIFEILDGFGERITTKKVDEVTKDVIEDHYAVHRDKYFFGYMTGSFIGRPVVLAVYQGNDIIQKMIEVIGHTDPQKAPHHTIRGRFSTDSLDIAITEGRPVKNVIHRSESAEEAEREMQTWASYLL